MPFGLMNRPVTSEKSVNNMLSRVKWKVALVYLDDVITYFETKMELLAHVQKVLQIVQRGSVTLGLA